MPATIALVVTGRCRPSPDRVPLSAPADGDARSIVPAGLSGGGVHGFLPVLRSPPAGVRRIDGDDRDTDGVGHRGEASAELTRGHTGDELPEAAFTAVLFPCPGVIEVQILDRDGGNAAGPCPVQQPRQGVPHLGVTVIGGARQVVEEPAGLPDRVAARVEPPGGEVVGIGVHADHAPSERGLHRDIGDDGEGPGCVHIPALPGHVMVDAVGHSPVGFHPVGPLGAPVRERHLRGQRVPAVLGVRQISERRGQLDADLAFGRDPDRLVAEPLA
ncbi:hypothetical protein [Streptosporangium sp. NBC_01756]|uniref:hypothetical protein n=1 Tax=Streptosporangium sp. NBC_01756 TaxID=2975950 RepID=UPI003FA3C946